MADTTLRLPQLSETAPQLRERPGFSYRFLYYRSAEGQEYTEAGQDYLAIRENDQRLAFALCDGVGQSFYGDVAARHLGDALLDWLWQLPISHDGDRLGAEMATFLAALTRSASEEIARVALPESLPPMVRSVLEEKRAHGGESTFVCGVLDVVGEWLALAWLGDTRLRIWDAEGRECTEALGPTFHTLQRWSTRRGNVGRVPYIHIASTNPDDGRGIGRILAYTDGLALLDPVAFPPSSEVLQEVIAASLISPTSDDLSLFDLAVTAGDDTPTLDVALPPAGDEPLPAADEFLPSATVESPPEATVQPAEINLVTDPNRETAAPPPPSGLPQALETLAVRWATTWRRLIGRRDSGPSGPVA